MPPTAEEALRSNGFSGERLLLLCRKIANDELRRRGAFLDHERLEDLVGFLALHGVRASVRYDPERKQLKYGRNGGDPFSSWLADILCHRVTDYWRSKAEGHGDRRYNLDNRIVLTGEKIEQEPDDAFERELAAQRREQGVDMDEAVAELGRGLSDEARKGIRLARLRAEGFSIPYESRQGKLIGRRLTPTGKALEAARSEIAASR